MNLLQTKIINTDTGYFVLPLTLIKREKFRKVIGSFTFDAHRPELQNHVFVLFSKDNLMDQELEYFKTCKCYQDQTDLDEHVLITFCLDKRFHEDHKKFMLGKFSQFSEDAKNAIGNHFLFKIKTMGGKTEDSSLFKILYPTKNDRLELEKALGDKLSEDSEIYSIPDIFKETFSLNRLHQIFE
jgi:hypothetical protein